MELSLITDALTIATTRGLVFAKIASQNLSIVYENAISSESSSSSSSSPAFATLAISAVDSISAPPIRPNSYKSAPRTLSRRIKRTRRRSLTGESDGEEDGFSGGDDGPFGGGGGGGGRGWNFGRYEGGSEDWEGESESFYSDLASDFVYEVLGWIALSNCVHFAFKKVVRIMGDSSRDKATIC
ncbi:glycine-rich protein [Tasmannia lanceolata]|uniref:glycine-rich protein n=1 Tax=Tasmannia lanceolata TaxID=3420 RepID=UPI00406293FF